MTNIRFRRIEEYKDIETLHKYQEIRMKGGDTAGFLKDQQLTARDNSRTPFQWNNGLHAGFTKGEPWIAVNANYRVINAAAQEGDADSVLAYVRRLVQLRRERKVLVYGGYRLLDPADAQVHAYERWDEEGRVLVVMNFSAQERVYGVGEKGVVWIGNYGDVVWEGAGVRLRPWEAVVMTVLPGTIA
jgi:oligo-1,6-glucosidase